jgi:uncharacterized protein
LCSFYYPNALSRTNYFSAPHCIYSVVLFSGRRNNIQEFRRVYPKTGSKYLFFYFGFHDIECICCITFSLSALASRNSAFRWFSFDDIIRFFRWILSFFIKESTSAKNDNSISRLQFFSYLAVAAAAIPGVGLLYGLFRGGYDYRVHRVKLSFPNLPDAFDGFKIVQLSDIHTGSFISPAPLKRAFQLALDQKPDAIFFTGDLVNDLPEETIGFESAFSMLRAPHGVYSIFGNHDYAEYLYHDEDQRHLRIEAQENLKKVHANAGWKLLMNEHTYLEKNGQKIGLIGVENWDAKKRFSKHGNMRNAIQGMEEVSFKILLSHSPSHWDEVIRKQYTDIDITFSGHTHGMQLGIEIPGLKWSPVKYLYRQWAGLYQDGQQYLYVNRGLGFIGFNGRLGIWPEITVVEFTKSKNKNEQA